MDSEKYVNLSLNKLILQCSIPAIVTSVFGAVYSMVDGLFVGRYLGGNALAAINLVMPVIMIIEALSNMIATGSSVHIALLLGEKKREDASRVFTVSIKVILVCSCVIGAMGFLFAQPFVELIAPGAKIQAIQFGTQYLKVYALFAPLIPINYALDNYLRVCGKQNFSMVVEIVSQLANVVLDFLLIVVFRQGIASAAVASCTSIVGASIVMLAAFVGKKLDIYYTKTGISMSCFFHIVANGASEFFSTISMSVISIIMNLFLLRYGGTTAIAAYSIVMYVDSIIGMITFSICDSMQPAISYCYGAGKIQRMNRIFKKTTFGIILLSVAAFLFMFFAGSSVAAAFIRQGDTTLKTVSNVAIRIFSISYLTRWIDMCFSSFFTAVDKPVHSLLVSVSGTLVFPVLFLCVLTKFLGLNGVWLTPFVAACASGTFTLILVKRTKIMEMKR